MNRYSNLNINVNDYIYGNNETPLQLRSLFNSFNNLQLKYGDKDLMPVYGAGDIDSPNLMLVFMNPTARNISSKKDWKGIRAPWLGTKNVWKLLFQTNLIDKETFIKIQEFKAQHWTEDFASKLYQNISAKSIYITNFAKCTQIDARPISNSVFKIYRELLIEEIKIVNPLKIITFGNQVSENLIQKKVSVKDYSKDEYELINIDDKTFYIYPCYYPVGQGQRNMPLAIKRIIEITKFL